MSTVSRTAWIIAAMSILIIDPSIAQRQMESLDRGVIVVRRNDGSVYVGWRMLGTDPNDIAFNVYRSTNFAVWWDDDLLRELEDGTTIGKWDWKTRTTKTLLTADGCASNNATKATPCLSADLFGDWREEVVWRTADNTALRVYTTTIPANNRFYTLMHDPQYRLAIAWQNVAYNQPPHPSFYLGVGMKAPPKPNVTLVKERGT